MSDAKQLTVSGPYPQQQIGEREIGEDLPVTHELLKVGCGVRPEVGLLVEQVGKRGHGCPSLGARVAGVGSPVVIPATIRLARADELAAVGALTVGVYRHGQLASEAYSATLADAQHRAQHTDILAAVDEQEQLLGAVALVLRGGPYAELSASESDAEFRMLVVAASARGKGIGTALIQECLARARAAGKNRMVISTGAKMIAAHRRYEELGFVRAPELDWSPLPGERLLAYVLELASTAG